MIRNGFTFFLLITLINVHAQESILGFTPENTKKQQQLEAAFEAKLDANNLDEWMQLMAAEPHWVGIEYGEKNAKWI